MLQRKLPSKFLTLALFLLLIILCTCDKEEDLPGIPILFTGEVTNISEEGAELSGKFSNVNPRKVVEYGFLFGRSPRLEPGKDMKHSFELPFKETIKTFVPGAFEDSVTYYTSIYVFYDDAFYLGNVVSFESKGSKPPVIHKIIPTEAHLGEIVTLDVSYIGYDSSSLRVYFNTDRAGIIEITDKKLRVRVPQFNADNDFFRTGKVKVSIEKFRKVSSPESFTVKPPEIISIKTNNLAYNNIFIEGKGFIPGMMYLQMDTFKLKVLHSSTDSLVSHLPPLFENITEDITLKIASNDNAPVFNIGLGKFEVKAPIFLGTDKDTVSPGDTLCIYGENLQNEMLHISFCEPIYPTHGLNININENYYVQIVGDYEPFCEDKAPVIFLLYNECVMRDPIIHEKLVKYLTLK